MGSPLMDRAARVFLNNYYPARVALVRGEGCRVFDDSGNSYLDLVGGIAVSSLGHCHPRVVKAIQSQTGTLMHVSNLYQHPLQVQLAELLTDQFPGGRTFFCNSGAEANEAAFKLARKFSHRHFGEKRPVIVTALNSFHGRTLATLTASGQSKYHAGVGPLAPGFRHVPYDDLPALEEAAGRDVCAVFLETIQGEGGVVVPSEGYLKGVEEICRRRGCLLMLDEVQTGLGRTGSFFDYQHEGIQPDVITLSKSLGGGLPFGAMLARGEAASAFEPGSHASTFGGNPVACAAALAFLECLLTENYLEKVREMGEFFRSGLASLAKRQPQIIDVRGRGLLLAAELSIEAKPLEEAALTRGYLLNAVRDRVLRFSPPFIITREDITEFLALLEELLRGPG